MTQKILIIVTLFLFSSLISCGSDSPTANTSTQSEKEPPISTSISDAERRALKTVTRIAAFGRFRNE